MQSDFSSLNEQPPASSSDHHHTTHHHQHHDKPAASSFSVLKAMLIAGPLVFVLLLVVITASVSRNQQPTQMLQTDQQSAGQQPQQTNAGTSADDMNYVPPQNSENKMQAQTVKNYGKVICNSDIAISNITENPACTGNVNASLSTYITRYEIFNRSGSGGNGRSSRTYVLSLQAQSNFCKQGTGNTGSYKCEYVSGQDSGEQLTPIQMTISGGEKKTVEIKRSLPAGLGSGDASSPECGDFQTDLWITKADQTVGNVNEKCTWTDTSSQPGKSGWNLLGAAYCGTNKTCVNVTPTPTQVSKSPTPTPKTPTATPKTPTVTPKPGVVSCTSLTGDKAVQPGAQVLFTCRGQNATTAKIQYIENYQVNHAFDTTLPVSNGQAQFSHGFGNYTSEQIQCSMCDANGLCTAAGTPACSIVATTSPPTVTPTKVVPTRTPTPPPAAVSCSSMSVLGSFLPTDPQRNVTFQCNGQNGTSAIARSYSDGVLIGSGNGTNYGTGTNQAWQGYVPARQYTNEIKFTCQICNGSGCSAESACTKTYTPPPPPGSPTCDSLTSNVPVVANGTSQNINFLCTGQNATNVKYQQFINGNYYGGSAGVMGYPAPGQSMTTLNFPASFQSYKVTCVLCNAAGCTSPDACTMQGSAPTSPTPTTKIVLSKTPTPPIVGGFCPQTNTGGSLHNGFYLVHNVATRFHVNSGMKTASGKDLFVVTDNATSKDNPYYGSIVFKNTQGVPVVKVWPYDADHTSQIATRVRITLRNGSYFGGGMITVKRTSNNAFASPIIVNNYVTKIEYFPGKDSTGWDSSEFGVECPPGTPAIPSINLEEPVEGPLSGWSSFIQMLKDLFSL